jgi:hypothetical protein
VSIRDPCEQHVTQQLPLTERETAEINVGAQSAMKHVELIEAMVALALELHR